MSGFLQDILDKGRAAGLADMTIHQKAARTWFKNEAMKISSINEADTKQMLTTGTELRLKGRLVPGYMYLFQYDAKLKMELPYWDSFPLIFPIETYDDGFLGINFHYLPPDYRAKLMDPLYNLAMSNEYDESVRLRISYEILKSSARYKYFRPCIKRYLYSNLRSHFYYVDWKEWPIILYLPFERFRTQTRFASARQVWSDSIQQVSNGGKK